MGYFVSKSEKDIWMCDKGDHYEHIAVYVDDLMIASKDPDLIIKMLMEKCHFKLKGTGPTKFHLGCDFFCDEEGVLCYAPKKYIEKILENYRRIYGTWPKPATSPLTTGDRVGYLGATQRRRSEDISVFNWSSTTGDSDRSL